MKTSKNNHCLRFITVMVVLLMLLASGIVLNINTGSVSIHAGKIFSVISKSICYNVLDIFADGKYEDILLEIINSSTENQIIMNIRLPRILLAMVLGGALSVSGFLLQSFFRNPIAGPFVLGISSGAKMAVGVTLVFLSGFIKNMGSGMLIVSAFIGSLIITFFVLLFSGKVKNMATLLVIGIMIGYICSAVTDFLITFANDQDIANLTNWSMGTFSGASWDNVKLAFLVCIPAICLSWFLSKPMSVYALGEGYAKSMGIKIKPFRILLILLSSLLSAAVTSLAGPVSFVGIAVPHITRTLIKSSKPSYIIPASFLCGSVFCVFCDLIARTVFAPYELAIGTVTSIFGAPFVIYVMIKQMR